MELNFFTTHLLLKVEDLIVIYKLSIANCIANDRQFFHFSIHNVLHQMNWKLLLFRLACRNT